MAAIDLGKLLPNMLNAAKGVLQKRWPEAKDYAESEFKKMGESLLFIEKQRAAGQMTEEQARLHMDIQKNTSRTVLLTLEGLGILAVEEAINAALAVIRDAVNSALGFALL